MDNFAKESTQSLEDYSNYRQQDADTASAKEFSSKYLDLGDVPAGSPQPTVDGEVAAVDTESTLQIKSAPEVELPQDGMLKRAGKDISRGVFGEGGRAIISGVAKSANEMLQTVDDFNQFLGDNVARGVLKVIGSSEQQKRGEQIIQSKKDDKLQAIPSITFGTGDNQTTSPKSVTGNLIEDVAQFLTGFGVAGKALQGIKATGKAAKAGKFMAQSALGDMLAFDEQEQRLSNVLESVPALQNPVSAYLQSNEDDGVLEGKMKQAIEGAGLGVAGEGLMKAAKILRQNKTLGNLFKQKETAAIKDPSQIGLTNEHLAPLGRPESNEFIYNKIDIASKETEGLTGKQINELSETEAIPKDKIRLYRGLEQEFDKNFDLTLTDAPSGYSTWTDNPELARQYAGSEGKVYQIDLPKKGLGKEMVDAEGERALFVDNQKAAGLNNISGKEFLIYTDSELYDSNLIKETGKLKNVKAPKFQNADEIQINFARIESPEDLKQAMQAYANETSLLPKVQDARRGVRTNEVTLKAAEDIDGFKTLLERREGQPLNAEQITSARNFYYSSTEKLMELAKKAASPTASDIDQYAFRKMVATHHAVQKEVLGARAEAGRALQAWSIPSTGTPADKLKGMETILDSFGGADASKELAKKLANFSDGALSTAQLDSLISKSAYARSRDALVEAWTGGLLTNPVTHSKNLLSNTLISLTSAAERYSQALFPNSDVTIQEANTFFMGILQSQKEALSNAARSFKTGQSGFGVGRIELPSVRASSKETLDLQGMAKPFGYAMDYYGRIANTAFRALTAGDEYSKTILYKAQLNALSTREALSKGLKGEELKDFVAKAVSNPEAKLGQEARDFAAYGTFQKELGKLGKSTQKILSQAPALKFVVPFFKTPANIFKYTFERTPLAVLAPVIREELSAGGTRQAAALAKIGMGSSMMMLATDMSINGHITGHGPSDKKTLAALKHNGWQPNSLRIGDKYYSYAGLEPLSTLFGFSSTMAEILTNYEMYDIEAQDEAEKITTAAVMAIVDSTVNKTFLQGISNITEAISNPERYGDAYISRFLSSFVPAGVAAVERAVNPEKEYVTNLADAFKARIPSFSNSVPKARNMYGEILRYRSPDENILDATSSGIVSLFNPFYVSTIKNDPLDEFLMKGGYEIGMPSKNQSFDGAAISLKEYPELYSRFVELRGQEVELMQYGNVNMKQALTDLVVGDLPQSIIFLSDFSDEGDKQKVIDKIVRDYSDAAKKTLQEEYPVIDQLILEDSLKKEQQLQ